MNAALLPFMAKIPKTTNKPMSDDVQYQDRPKSPLARTRVTANPTRVRMARWQEAALY